MAGPDFTTVGGELTYWFSHITQRFKGGWDGSGENGIDVGMPTGTPVYAVAPGRVVGHGYYAGGGVVSIEQQKGMVWYYQHLDLAEPGIESGQVTTVQPGQLIGWSGGQLAGGRHPSSRKFSTGPHIEVGVNAPWGGIWGPKEDKGPNVDPLPFLEAIAQSGGGGGTTGTPWEPAAFFGSNDCSQYSPVDPRGWVCALTSQFKTLTMWLADPLRILKLGAGVALFGIAALMVIGSLTLRIAPTGYEVAATAAGQPEIAAGARALKPGTSTGERARTGAHLYRAHRTKAAKPAPAPKAAKAPKPAPAPKAPKAPKEEPVYYGGKQIGTTGPDGKIKLNKNTEQKEAS